DSEKELQKIAEFIRDEIDPETPWHVTRFYPMYKLSHLNSTPTTTLKKAREIGLKTGLKYIYVGNVPGDPGENTYCPSCSKLLIERYGYEILEYNLKNSKCSFCGFEINGVWI
ncbi:MAG: radical SAM protein, partial [Candidatus Bathyarchaeia archaeon]